MPIQTVPKSIAGALAQHHLATADSHDLLDLIGPVDGSRALLIGTGTLDLMCALIRGGCVGVTCLHDGERLEPGSADLVVVSGTVAASLAAAGGSCCLAARVMPALAPLGSLMAVLPLDRPANDARRLGPVLRLHGFSAIRVQPLPDGRTAILAERPLLGSLV